MSDAMYGTMSLRTVKDYEPRQSSHVRCGSGVAVAKKRPVFACV